MYSAKLFGIALLAIATAALVENSPLKKRDQTTAWFGDYNGQKSTQPDGSGTYQYSADGWNYTDHTRCWTDLYFTASAFNASGDIVTAYIRRRCDNGGVHTVWSHDYYNITEVPGVSVNVTVTAHPNS